MKVKKLLLVSFLVVLVNFKAVSQGVMFVEDVTSIATAIENGLTMYKQLQQSIDTYKQIKEQLKALKEQVTNLDLTTYDWTKLDTYLGLVDDYMSYYDQLDNLVNKKAMRLGNVSYSLKDLYTTDLYVNLLDEAELQLNPYNLTERDQANFMARHGLSPKHYYTIMNIEHEIGDEAAKIKAVLDAQKKTQKTLADGAAEVTKKSQDPVENELMAQQIGNQMLVGIQNSAILIGDTVQRTSELLADYVTFTIQTATLDQVNIDLTARQLEDYIPLRDCYTWCGNRDDYLNPNTKTEIR